MSRGNGNGSTTLAVRAEVCPVHGRMVPVDRDGRLVGRCDMCVEEADHGLQVLMEIARRRAEGGDA